MQQVNTWAKYLVKLVIPCITGTIIGWDGIIHFNFAKDTGSLSHVCLSTLLNSGLLVVLVLALSDTVAVTLSLSVLTVSCFSHSV